MKKLHFLRAEEVVIEGSKKAAVIFVPTEEISAFHADAELCAAFEK